MGRKRKHNRELPERVYLRGRQYVYLPFGQTKYISLGRTLAEAMVEYGRLKTIPTRIPGTISDCMDDYMRSPAFARLADRTREDYRRDIARLRKVYGHMRPSEIRPADIYMYMRQRGAVRARLEVAVLKNVLDVAIMSGLIDRNPAAGLRYEPIIKRTRVPSPQEIESFCAMAPPQIAAYVRLKLATGLRMGDMLRLDRGMVSDDALTVTPAKTATKTGKTIVFLLTGPDGTDTGLRQILADVKALRRRVTALALFATRDGQHYTTDGWKSLWQRAMRAYEDAGGVRFREHDLRAAAGIAKEDSAGRGEAMRLLGHDLESTTARYTGRRNVVKVTPNK